MNTNNNIIYHHSHYCSEDSFVQYDVLLYIRYNAHRYYVSTIHLCNAHFRVTVLSQILFKDFHLNG